MAVYTGINGKARKAKKLYIGVGGKARKVKRAYIGINGKARLFFSGVKQVSAQSIMKGFSGRGINRTDGATGELSSYALFAGGVDIASNAVSSSVDTFDKSGTYSLRSSLSEWRYNTHASRIGASANASILIPGGNETVGTSYIYTDSLVRSTISGVLRLVPHLTNGSGQHPYAAYGCPVGYVSGYAVNPSGSLIYGTNGSIMTTVRVITAVNPSGTISQGGDISESHVWCYNNGYNTIASGKYALFAGGASGSPAVSAGYNGITTVEVVSSSLTLITCTSLPVKMAESATGILEKRMIVGGGVSENGARGQVYVSYDDSLTMTQLSGMSFSARKSTSFPGMVLFAESPTSICAVDESLTRTYIGNHYADTSQMGPILTAAHVGDTAYIGDQYSGYTFRYTE